MKAVGRLVWTGFLVVFGRYQWLVYIVPAVLIVLLQSAFAESGFSTRTWQIAGLFAFVCLLTGTMMLPSAVSRLARSRQIDLLPFGRLKLLGSALATIAIFSVPAPIMIITAMKTAGPYGLQDVAYFGHGVTVLDYVQTPFFWYLYWISVLSYTWLYVVLWSAADASRSVGASTRTLLLLVVLPVPFVHQIAVNRVVASPKLVAMLAAVLWSLFVVGYLITPRLKFVAAGRPPLGRLIRHWLRFDNAYVAGGEIRAVLKLSTPWVDALLISLVAMVLLLPIKLHTLLLVYVTLFAFWAGGLPAHAPARARSLWLRRMLSRSELFTLVETAMWRQAVTRLAILLAWLAIISFYKGFIWQFVAVSALHLCVVAAASLYLGLIQTSRTYWTAGLAIGAAMLAILGAIAGSGDLIGVPLVTALLAAFALGLRHLAKRRWAQLDWTQCRPNRSTEAAVFAA